MKTKALKPRHNFTPPTLAQVADYAAALNVVAPAITAQKFIDCYAPEWRDSYDRPIRNWKMKFRQVWAKNNRLPHPPRPAITENWTL
ncbi:MAG: hypothetical protein GXY55_13345 [Phycisphaerae bacterium]|nr:hypothetical protein [Phycisphaerae bacterium]